MCAIVPAGAREAVEGDAAMSLGVEFLPVDVTQLVAVALGCMIPLIFVLGITMRFAAKPLVEALGKLRENGAPARELEVLSRRVLELEQEVLRLRGAQGSSAPALEPGARCGSGGSRHGTRTMDTLPVDLVEMVAAIMGSLLVLIPVLGLAIRFAARPLVDALVASKGEGARPVDIDALKMRIEALEHEVKDLSGQSTRVLPGPVPIRP
jgi:cell division protein FtsB